MKSFELRLNSYNDKFSRDESLKISEYKTCIVDWELRQLVKKNILKIENDCYVPVDNQTFFNESIDFLTAHYNGKKNGGVKKVKTVKSDIPKNINKTEIVTDEEAIQWNKKNSPYTPWKSEMHVIKKQMTEEKKEPAYVGVCGNDFDESFWK
jgi:hypothetical protein